ncbi:hypothetical protein [Ammoniphilus sp. 3BR4]|uniref:hypothetical protein n=1 Tax=Ammoniphilus sp. 3BR4 TaxID=3158265 RepID=UPI003465959C
MALLMTISIYITGYASCIEFDIEEALKNDEAIFAGKVRIQPQVIKIDKGTKLLSKANIDLDFFGESKKSVEK